MFDITATDTDEEATRKRSTIARLLMERGAEAIDPYQMQDGYRVPVSPLQGLDKIAASMAGAYIEKRRREKARAGIYNTNVSPGTGGTLGATGTAALSNQIPASYGLINSLMP